MHCAAINVCNRCAKCCADDGEDGGFSDSAGWGDTDYGNDEGVDAVDLLDAPRKVEKISVTYSKASKQVRLINPSINSTVIATTAGSEGMYRIDTLLALVALARNICICA